MTTPTKRPPEEVFIVECHERIHSVWFDGKTAWETANLLIKQWGDDNVTMDIKPIKDYEDFYEVDED